MLCVYDIRTRKAIGTPLKLHDKAPFLSAFFLTGGW